VVQAILHIEPTEFSMKRLLVSGFVAAALLAAATTMLWSRSYRSAADAGLSQNAQTAANVNKLPVEEFEDMSLVFSSGTKR
jgi:hypothetical protein